MTTALIKLDEACRALVSMTSIEDVKEIRDQAQAAIHYMKQRGFGLQAQNSGAEVKIRAERKLGELVPDMITHGGNPRSHAATLKSIGISKQQVFRYRQIFGIEEPDFERHVAETIAANKELTTSGVLKLAKKLEASDVGETDDRAHTVDNLQELIDAGKTFGTIYADPPWDYENQGTRAATSDHYRSMSVDAICSMPIGKLAAAKSHLHLWTTNAFLFECPKILEAWGFEYKSVFVWVKPQIGIGNYWRVSHEFLVLGVRGNHSFIDKGQSSWMCEERTEHSTKPSKIRRTLEKVSPGPRLELFGRQPVDGWVVWGNQITKSMFDQLEELKDDRSNDAPTFDKEWEETAIA